MVAKLLLIAEREEDIWMYKNGEMVGGGRHRVCVQKLVLPEKTGLQSEAGSKKWQCPTNHKRETTARVRNRGSREIISEHREKEGTRVTPLVWQRARDRWMVDQKLSGAPIGRRGG